MTYKAKSLIYFSVFMATTLIYYVTDTHNKTEKEIYVAKDSKIIEAAGTTTTTAEIKLEDKE